MPKAEKGNVVDVHYKGTLDDGTMFDSSEGREPLSFTLGSGEVIVGFDEGVLGMEVGEKKLVNIPAEKAYGPHRKELVLEVGRDQLPPDVNPNRGDKLEMQDPNGNRIPVTVSGLTDEHIILDANPPLAGENLNFELELVAVK